MASALNPEHLTRIVNKHNGKRGAIIAILEDIQAEYNYLPQEALEFVAEKTAHSLVDIYGVATFYKSFSLEPRGAHLISACVGTACHVRGAPRILEEFERIVGVKAGETREDRKFTLNTVNCLGACALGPVAVVDGEYHRYVSTKEVGTIVEQCQRSPRNAQVVDDQRVFQVKVACPRCNYSLMDHTHKIDGYPSIRVLVAFGDKHGWLRLSSLYGSYNTESEHEIPEDQVIHFFCNRCHAELRSNQECTRCAAPVVPLLVRGGGVINICSRQGCKEHMLHLTPDDLVE